MRGPGGVGIPEFEEPCLLRTSVQESLWDARLRHLALRALPELYISSRPMIETPLRPRIDLNRNWQFVRRRVGRTWIVAGSEDAESVNLPHSWNMHDTFQHGRTSYAGWGAYRRRIMPVDRSSVGQVQWRLRTGGFYGSGDLWIDGRRHTSVDGQFLGISVDLPRTCAENGCTIGARLDNRRRRNVLPGRRIPDFILHGGLAGSAWLEGVPPVHFDLDATQIVCEGSEGRDERIGVRWRLGNSDSAAGTGRVTWRIEDSDGEVLDTSDPEILDLSRVAGKNGESAGLLLRHARCWSPDEPNLYWAVGELEMGGVVTDVVRIRFGVTRAEFRPRRGLHLDGKRTDLHGCNRHEAIPGIGSALPDELQRRDAQVLKELGCNFVRLSHYPQSPTFLDACDELGMMVYAEIATWKSVSSAAGWRRSARRQMHDLIVRDRHHPSLLLWGMGNESRSRKAYLELRTIAHDLDPSRPVTYAENHLYRARRQRTIGIPDVWGTNYELDALEEARDASRLENVILAECCNHPTTPRGDVHEELAQVFTIEREWEAMADRPYLAGYAVWSMTDYATEYRDRYRRLTGIIDAWRSPKMAAELFRARHADRPFVSLFITPAGLEAPPSRYRREVRDAEQGVAQAELHVFTNCETVRLVRDGRALGVLEGALHYVVPLHGSVKQILATGSRDGMVVERCMKRHGDAADIDIAPAEAVRDNTIEVDLTIRDDAGTPVVGWMGTVDMTVTGAARLLTVGGEGSVEIARGTGRTYLRIEPEADEIALTASCAGLPTASVTVQPVG